MFLCNSVQEFSFQTLPQTSQALLSWDKYVWGSVGCHRHSVVLNLELCFYQDTLSNCLKMISSRTNCLFSYLSEVTGVWKDTTLKEILQRRAGLYLKLYSLSPTTLTRDDEISQRTHLVECVKHTWAWMPVQPQLIRRRFKLSNQLDPSSSLTLEQTISVGRGYK